MDGRIITEESTQTEKKGWMLLTLIFFTHGKINTKIIEGLEFSS
jgi:hypothetical protein